MPDAGQPVKCAKEPCPLADLAVRVVERTTGSPIENAAVTVSTLGTKPTGADGWARWEKINPGTYDVSARKDGHDPDPGQQLGVNAPASTTTTTEIRLHLLKSLKGEVIEVEWRSGIKTSLVKTTVATPHWKVGLAVDDGAGSKRPGVYLVEGKGADAVSVKVRITENKNVSGDGTLRGQLGDLQIKGTCPTAVGEHSVSAKILKRPDSIQHFQGDVSWGLEVPDLSSTITLTNTTRLEAFVVLDTPASFYDPPGVWVEALRFLCDKVNVIGLKDDPKVASKVTSYCHGGHGLKYDTAGGRPAYGVTGSGGTFKLDSYIKAALTVVNCYDQAGAIQSLCGAVGVKLTWYYLAPYGFIKTTNLIGIGSCNNPFYSTNGSTPVVPADDPKRTAFGNHAFGGLTGKVLDACAGPHTGTEDKKQYCAAAIDSAPALYGGGFRAGTDTDITAPGGVSHVV